VNGGLGIGAIIAEVGDAEPRVVRVLPALAPIPVPAWLVAHREAHTSRRVHPGVRCHRGAFRLRAVARARAPGAGPAARRRADARFIFLLTRCSGFPDRGASLAH